MVAFLNVNSLNINSQCSSYVPRLVPEQFPQNHFRHSIAYAPSGPKAPNLLCWMIALGRFHPGAYQLL